jgi:hypothetical protein
LPYVSRGKPRGIKPDFANKETGVKGGDKNYFSLRCGHVYQHVDGPDEKSGPG